MVPKNFAEILRNYIAFEFAGIDRMTNGATAVLPYHQIFVCLDKNVKMEKTSSEFCVTVDFDSVME
jgi:hypothetical protein